MTTRIPRSDLRVFVAAASEDDERVMSAWLSQDAGAEILGTALDGDEAVRAARELRPDLVVANVNLRGASGLELVEQLWATSPDIGCVIVADAGSLGAHRRAMRAGALDFIVPPLGPAEAESLRGAARQVARRRDLIARSDRPVSVSHPAAAAGAVTAVVSAKGGVGRSTVAATIASWLAEKSATCLCDLDLRFGDLGFWGSTEAPARTIAHLAPVVSANETTESDIRAVGTVRFGKVTLLAAPGDLTEDSAFPAEALVQTLARWYGHVIVDTEPRLDDSIRGIAAIASFLIVVTTCEIGAIRATQRYLALLDGLGRRPRLIVANRADRGERKATITQAFGPGEEILFVDEDREYAHRLVVDGQAGPQQPRREISKRLRGIADRLQRTTA